MNVSHVIVILFLLWIPIAIASPDNVNAKWWLLDSDVKFTTRYVLWKFVNKRWFWQNKRSLSYLKIFMPIYVVCWYYVNFASLLISWTWIFGKWQDKRQKIGVEMYGTAIVSEIGINGKYNKLINPKCNNHGYI